MRTLTYTIPPEEDGRLIKRVIRGSMGVSHHQFSMLKTAEGLLLDGRAVHANEVVRVGQTISLTLVEDKMRRPVGQDAPIEIVYEDEDLLIINKSAPLACQSSPRQPDNTLENRVAHYFRDQPSYVFRPVNRLDKGTSGLMVVAKNAHAQRLLGLQLHTDSFVRIYLAVVLGTPIPPEGVVDAPIRKAEGATVRRETHPDGKPARTFYETVASTNGLSLVRLRLDTGRTHQIRVHMASIGCPVFGDFLYGTEDARLPGRFALHSAHLEINHPTRSVPLCFDAPLPESISSLLNVVSDPACQAAKSQNP